MSPGGTLGGGSRYTHRRDQAAGFAFDQARQTLNELNTRVSAFIRQQPGTCLERPGVAEAARHTSSGASDAKNAATELARMAADLRRVISQFAY